MVKRNTCLHDDFHTGIKSPFHANVHEDTTGINTSFIQILNCSDRCLDDDLGKRQEFFQSFFLTKQPQLQNLQGAYSRVNKFQQSTNNNTQTNYNYRLTAKSNCAGIETELYGDQD